MALISALNARPANAAGWQDSVPLAPAVARAAKDRVQVLVRVSTSWCPSCREQEAVLREPSVARELTRFALLHYDAEEGEGKDVAERYNVISFPTLLLIGPDGREVGRVTGHHPAPKLLEELRQIASGAGTLAKLEEQLAKRPDDLELRLRVGTEWALRGSLRQATDHLQRVLSGDLQNQRSLAAAALLAEGKYLFLRSLKAYPQAVSTLASLRTKYPRAEQAGQAVFPLAQALHRLGRSDEALRLLESHARTAEDHDDLAWFCLRERTALTRGLTHAEQAVALSPRNASFWEHLAELAELAGKPEVAARAWSRAAALEPANRRYAERARALSTPGPAR